MERERRKARDGMGGKRGRGEGKESVVRADVRDGGKEGDREGNKIERRTR